MSRRIAVIGAGASGIIASWRAASHGASVVAFEKTPRIGTKILISGGGKCNITHDGPLENVLKAFRTNEARFIRPSCYRFPPMEIVRMLTSRGLQVYTRPDGRIFPVEQTAKDVVAILQSYLVEAGVEVRFETPITAIRQHGAGWNLVAGGEEHKFDAVIVTVGGKSYPNSGTTGDGYGWLKELGHSIVPIKAALAPINLDPEPPKGWPGVALRDVMVRARRSGKVIARWRGDMLFTHHGLSGPTILGISREIAESSGAESATIEVDLAPDLAPEALTANVVQWCTQNSRRQILQFVEGFLPRKLAEAFLESALIAPCQVGQEISKKGKNRLAERLKNWHLGSVREVILPKGEVVAGGVSLEEVDPQTMESRVCPGLYLAGEVLDIAGPVGGYNLQAAWATGYVAGESAAKSGSR